MPDPLTDEALAAVLVDGLQPIRVLLVEHDPRWFDRFAARAAQLERALGPRARFVEHVGSTAVPGLAAKPVVDIQVSVADADREETYLPRLEAAGYHLRVRQPDHRMVRTAEFDVHVHICPAGGKWERDHLLFVDWLRTSSADRLAYEKLKRDLATRDWFDMNQYAEAKGDLIDEILGRAEHWAARTGWSVDERR